MQNMENMHGITYSWILYIFCIWYIYRAGAPDLVGWCRHIAVNTDTTPVQRDRRQAQRGVQFIMVFIQKTSNFIWKHWKHGIIAHLSNIAMQNHFPSQSMVTPVLSATSSQEVCNEASNLSAVPYVDSNAWKSPLDMKESAEASFWNQLSALRGTLSPVLWSLTSQSSVSSPSSIRAVINKNVINMQNMSKIDKYA